MRQPRRPAEPGADGGRPWATNTAGRGRAPGRPGAPSRVRRRRHAANSPRAGQEPDSAEQLRQPAADGPDASGGERGLRCGEGRGAPHPWPAPMPTRRGQLATKAGGGRERRRFRARAGPSRQQARRLGSALPRRTACGVRAAAQTRDGGGHGGAHGGAHGDGHGGPHAGRPSHTRTGEGARELCEGNDHSPRKTPPRTTSGTKYGASQQSPRVSPG